MVIMVVVGHRSSHRSHRVFVVYRVGCLVGCSLFVCLFVVFVCVSVGEI